MDSHHWQSDRNGKQGCDQCDAMTKKKKKRKGAKEGGSEQPLLEEGVSQSNDEREVVYNQQRQLQQACSGLLVSNSTSPGTSGTLVAIFVAHFDNLNGGVVWYAGR